MAGGKEYCNSKSCVSYKYLFSIKNIDCYMRNLFRIIVYKI